MIFTKMVIATSLGILLMLLNDQSPHCQSVRDSDHFLKLIFIYKW